MSRHYKRYTREDVMQGIVHISGTLCDFECVIVGNYPQQHKVDDGVYTIDYKRTMTLKQMLRMEMVETRRDKNVLRMGRQDIDAISNFNPNARDLVKLIHWALNYLKNCNCEEFYEPIRVDRAVIASIEKVNDWFDDLEAKGVSIFERPDLCEPFTAPQGTLYANQSICTEELFREYRRRMGMVNIQNAYPDYNNMVNIPNVYSDYNNMVNIPNVYADYNNMVNFQNAYSDYNNMVNIQNAYADFNKMVNNVVSGYNPLIHNVLGAYKYM